MRTFIAAGLLALSGLMTTAVGAASADEQYVGTYPSLMACEHDGPTATIPNGNEQFTRYQCREGNDGMYYLYLLT